MKSRFLKTASVTSALGIVMSFASVTAMAAPSHGGLSSAQLKADLQKGLQILNAEERKQHSVPGKVASNQYQVKLADGSVVTLQKQSLTVPTKDAAYVQNVDDNLTYTQNSVAAPAFTNGEALTTYSEATVNVTYAGDIAGLSVYGTFDYQYNTPDSFTHALHTQTSTWNAGPDWSNTGMHPSHGTVNDSTAYVDDYTQATFQQGGQELESVTEYIELECDYFGVTAAYGEPSGSSYFVNSGYPITNPS